MASVVQAIVQHFNEARLVATITDATTITAIAGFVGRIFWKLASDFLKVTEEWLSKKPKKIKIVIAKSDGIFNIKKVKPRCLIVRYGTDQYIERIASDSEKYTGRLRNTVIDISVSQSSADSAVYFTLSLPVHRRLGTQFKCFVDVLDDSKKEAVINFLSQSPQISNPSTSASAHGTSRIYFLLKVPECTTVTTVEGYANNMCFPH
ncbi:MAG: hypothetical protein Q8Q82_06910 [Hydrogenophaga sp.]|jgi:hypothetical protein|nr:hypothetical protein [Hydrogenophaga sp.]MDZ4357021.1 hypothetical protein [Variovorax sp.]